jgi:K+ transporter
MGNGPPNERVSLRNRQSVQHEVYCLNGKFGFAAQQKIDQFLKVISRFGWVKNSRYLP